MTATARAGRDLIKTALNPERPGTVGDLMRVAAAATGSRGAILWEAPGELRGDRTLSVLALSIEGLGDERTRVPVPADPLTAQALADWSLAICHRIDDAPTVHGVPVRAALPIDYADGCHGVLTLLGPTAFPGDAFDIAVELVDVLPELIGAVRERQTLYLINACNAVLHDADVESPPGSPPSWEELGVHLRAVCDYLAGALQCPEVSIHLREPGSGSAGYRLLTACSGAAPGGPAVPDEPVDLVRSGVAVGEEPLMEVRLERGAVATGLLRCRGSNGPPHHFTTSDLALLRPIAAQVGRYWRNWLQRRAIRHENDSWRRLAEGVTSFNKLVADRLGDDGGDRSPRQVAEAAVGMVREVVRDCSGAAVLLATERTAGGTPPVLVAGDVDVGRLRIPSAAGHKAITDRAELAAAGCAEDVGWLRCTPIGVGERTYGELRAVGPSPALPANSAQIQQIIADQLGLHRDLRDARQRLEQNRKAEAAAMEDLKHQLASPLQAAVNRAELMLSDHHLDQRVEAQLRAVRGLCRKAGRVALSAGVFATLGKGEHPAPRLELYGVDDLLRTLIAAAADAQILGDPTRRITFDVDRDTVRALSRRLVEIDASFLQQCVGNLLDNAAKYAYPETRVEIAARLLASTVTVTVTSTGIPLSTRDVELCLGRNWRGRLARATTGEGSGLGLWIVDNLMRAMHGHVHVEAAAEQTVVGLTLPVR